MSSTNSAVEAMYGTAMWLLDAGRHRDAMHVFRALMLAAPTDERGWLGLGECHERLDEGTRALALYDLGATITVGARCHVARARIFRGMGDDASAAEALEAAVNASERLCDPALDELIGFERGTP
jgi:hypothetical protein